MAVTGISKYRPQLYTPKWASYYNKQAVANYDAAVSAAADLFSSQMSSMGSDMVNLTIQKAAARIQKQAQEKIAAATAKLDVTA